MNKLPTKQIYLLTIIVVGIIALSVYSTYALFTFESSTSDIVSIHTPKSLKISENTYEYQQLTVEPNTVTTTDIDIYNVFDYDVCYSIWYKIVGTNIDEDKVQIFQISNESLTTSGVLTATNSIRVTIAIVNDNDTQVKINFGTISSQKSEESCSLNLTDDKKVISTSHKNLNKLSEILLENKNKIKEEEANYLTYKAESNIITYKSNDKIYVSEKFNYDNELFTLEEFEYLTIEEIANNLENKNIYFCENSEKCSVLYKITEIEKSNADEEETYYDIKVYDKLVGYSKSTSGLRQINEKDYVYYGDNPNNFIYYNCENNNDTSTCELWRIIGLFYNEKENKYNVKIIRNDSVGKYQFNNQTTNDESIWLQSTLHKYLNEEYKFKNNYDMYLEEFNQQIEKIANLETSIKNIKLSNQTINSKVNLMNLSDYINTSSCQKDAINEYTEECLKNNWLNNIELEKEWTLTSKEIIMITDNENKENAETEEIESTTEKSEIINYSYSVGNSITESNAIDYLETRPVVFLKTRMLLINGDGSFEKPYIIK